MSIRENKALRDLFAGIGLGTVIVVCCCCIIEFNSFNIRKFSNRDSIEERLAEVEEQLSSLRERDDLRAGICQAESYSNERMLSSHSEEIEAVKERLEAFEKVCEPFPVSEFLVVTNLLYSHNLFGSDSNLWAEE